MDEIVPVDDPIYTEYNSQPSTSYHDAGASTSASTSEHPRVTKSLTYHGPKPFDSERLPITLAPEIQEFLRVANLIESEEPRVAYLCRFHAFALAHKLDCNSVGRGVRQFKTSLLKRLEQDEGTTLMRRKSKSDIRELGRVYHEYRDNIMKKGGAYDLDSRENLTNAQRIASVLIEVLKTFTSAAGHSDQQGVPERNFYVTYNILPLDQVGIQHAIMQLPEIKAAVAAVCNAQADDLQQDASHLDLFDFLQNHFGFQDGNVANQKEHLLLLLANTHIRQNRKQTSLPKLEDKAVDELMKKFFKNYTNWCRFLGRKSNIRLPYGKQEAQQYKLLYLALYLLIWGEAANLRFMPECLCYIFHHMADEMHGILTGAMGLVTNEKVVPAYGGGPETFLNDVVTPIYKVIYEEAEKNKNGTADHCTWRNYDDLNEYFWSPACFEIGWPMRLDHDFFCIQPSNSHSNHKSPVSQPSNSHRNHKSPASDSFGEQMMVSPDGDTDVELGGTSKEEREPKWLGKTNFTEIRSFWHIFRSFDRMWSFLILALQAMIIMACHDLNSPLRLFEKGVFEDIFSIFVTLPILKLIQAILDIVFAWKAKCTIDFSEKRRHGLNLATAAAWTIILPTCYATSRKNYTCYSTRKGSWFEQLCVSPYMVAVAIYMTTNAVRLVLFFVPAVTKYIEVSNCPIIPIYSWWAQPRLFVGRGMQESQVSKLKYTFFWLLVLSSKFLFSYFFEIRPLIEPTRQIMKIGVKKYEWHELLPIVQSNVGAIVAIWAPVIVVYFMDTQIWYSVFCTIVGGLYGILHHLGEIRTLGMLGSRFQSLPSAFSTRLIPPSKNKQKNKRQRFLGKKFQKDSKNDKSVLAKFVLMWNQIVKELRSEDLISNWELDLMIIPMSSELLSGIVRWPIFLLANKLSIAVSIAKNFVGKDEALSRKICKDKNMYHAVKDCYDLLKDILNSIVLGDLEKSLISSIKCEIEESIGKQSLLKDFNLSCLPALQAKCVKLAELLLDGNECHHNKVVEVLQDIFEIVTYDLMVDGGRILNVLDSFLESGDYASYLQRSKAELFDSTRGKDCIVFPLPDRDPLKEKIKRFYLLLTIKDTAVDVPSNLEARRRISFFATSLFMDMPHAPKVRSMLSFSVLTPHFLEDINFSTKELHSSEEEVSIIYYMKRIFPDEWKNFSERVAYEDMEGPRDESKEEELRNWASFRGQTLSRTGNLPVWSKYLDSMLIKLLTIIGTMSSILLLCTFGIIQVRGMMYYREALKLQAFLDMAEDRDIIEGYESVERENSALAAQLDALADLKFTYVVSCQLYGQQKASGDPHAKDVLELMKRYPSLRVAYIEEKEAIGGDKNKKVYSSVLLKSDNGYDQEIYRIKLPGNPRIGEGKPENQNHAIIFTRGEALQTIDMNQDNYLEETIKMRNLLQEFLQHKGHQPPTIIGLREHIFTGSVSSLAWFMSYQETSFVTIGQRLLANPLRVRFHYGHPDVFDRIFHLTRGGISKASKTINLSEDVFAGFNCILRRGKISYREYMQVGKGRDVGLNQISKFEAKVANGNSEQTLSRDIYRLGQQFDFFRMLSCYFTTIGFYFSSLIAVIGIYVFLYGQLYLVLSGLEKALIVEARVQNIRSLETALASQSFIQLGLLTGLPMIMEIGLERGFLMAVKDFVLMQLQLAAVFFTFSFGTKTHYYGRTILHGGAKYRPTGRKVVVFHASFSENYRLYSRSHFVKGFELLLLLIIYDMFRRSYQSSMAYVLITYSIWFMSITWLFGPFLFNPSGFDWAKIVDDWKDWNKWIKLQGGIGVHPDKSWESWWIEEQAHIRHSGLIARLIEILLSLRFFLYQYGLVYHLDISQQSHNFMVYVLSWIVLLAIFLLVKALNMGRQQFSIRRHLVFRFFKVFLFLGVISIITTLSAVCSLSMMDIVVCTFAFLPTGWGLILITQAVGPMIKNTRIWPGLWDFTRVLARAYDYGMGIILFTPIACLAWLPIISAFQTRFLFNEAFNRHLQIHSILSGKRKKKDRQS